jgi:DNA repair exonuclease SbcCD ATPase subunit
MEGLVSSLNTISSSVEGAEDFGKKVDELLKSVKDDKGKDDVAKKLATVQKTVEEVRDSKENQVIIKKLDELLIEASELKVLNKKLDDLQSYIAGFSEVEAKLEDLSNQFTQTNEIVGIIVRQLDDIERKYNTASEQISEAAEKVEAALADAGSSAPRKAEKSAPKDEPESEKPVRKKSLPSTIDATMNELIDMVTPHTEATAMAKALERARDTLTEMIEGHTPVLFQFGKKARELKSYPPTATLNENDIALLSKDIKAWTKKLKEIT